jgi:hypothetical protein
MNPISGHLGIRPLGLPVEPGVESGARDQQSASHPDRGDLSVADVFVGLAARDTKAAPPAPRALWRAGRAASGRSRPSSAPSPERCPVGDSVTQWGQRAILGCMTDDTPAGEAPDEPGYATVFREFLYADIERTKSLFAQRLGGVPQEDRVTESALRRFSVGFQSYLTAGRESRNETYEQRSLLDALFPALEELLETEGWLTDISDIFNGSRYDDLKEVIEPGSIIRLTTDGHLFDATYIAEVLAGTATAAGGIVQLSGAPGGGGPPPRQKPKGQRGKPAPVTGDDIGPRRLEEMIDDFPTQAFPGVTAEQFRAMVKLARGMFQEGLHLHFDPDGASKWTASARLQTGRQYLDAEPDILFSRYGTRAQEWTVVGTVGHFSEPPPSSVQTPDFAPGGRLKRSTFVSGVNSFLSYIGSQGLADAPSYPGFSIVPLAVYRMIPRSSDAGPHESV